jgi:Sulfotransferase family
MLAFLHIPKTAGTSFAKALSDIFSMRTYSMLTDDNLEPARRSLGDCELIMGHFTMHGILRHFPDAQILTMLRHPVTRAISQYQGWHDSPVDPNWESYLERDKIAAEALAFTRGADIEQYFASEWEPITRQFTNYQTYILSGRRIPSTPFKVWEVDVLEEAKKNLTDSIRFCGLTERMDESLVLLRATLGFRGPIPPVAALNPSLHRSEQWRIPEIVRRIESRSPMDLELYQWVENEFTRQHATFFGVLR